MTKAGANPSMSHIRKRVAFLGEGVQGMSHLFKSLFVHYTYLGLRGIFLGMPPLSDFWALSLQVIRAEKENSF